MSGSHYDCRASDSTLQSVGNALHFFAYTSDAWKIHPTLSSMPALRTKTSVLYGPSPSKQCHSPSHIQWASCRGCVSLFSSSQSFLSMHSSPFFKTGLHNLFAVSIDASGSWWDVTCTNFCSCVNTSLGREVAVWKKSVAHASALRGRSKSANPCRILYFLFTTTVLHAMETPVHNHGSSMD